MVKFFQKNSDFWILTSEFSNFKRSFEIGAIYYLFNHLTKTSRFNDCQRFVWGIAHSPVQSLTIKSKNYRTAAISLKLDLSQPQ